MHLPVYARTFHQMEEEVAVEKRGGMATIYEGA